MSEILAALGRIEQSVKAWGAAVEAAFAGLGEYIHRLDARVRILEEWAANEKIHAAHRLVDRSNADSNEQERTVGGPDHV